MPPERETELRPHPRRRTDTRQMRYLPPAAGLSDDMKSRNAFDDDRAGRGGGNMNANFHRSSYTDSTQATYNRHKDWDPRGPGGYRASGGRRGRGGMMSNHSLNRMSSNESEAIGTPFSRLPRDRTFQSPALSKHSVPVPPPEHSINFHAPSGDTPREQPSKHYNNAQGHPPSRQPPPPPAPRGSEGPSSPAVEAFVLPTPLPEPVHAYPAAWSLLRPPALLGVMPEAVASRAYVPRQPPQYDPLKAGENPAERPGLQPRVENMNLQQFVAMLTAHRASQAVHYQPPAPKATPPPPTESTRTYELDYMYSLRMPAIQMYGHEAPTMATMQGGSTDHHGNLPRSHNSGHHRRRSLGSQFGASPHRGGGSDQWNGHRGHNATRLEEMPAPHVRPALKDMLPAVALRRQVKGLLNKMTVEKFIDIADNIAKLLESLNDEEELKVIVDEVYNKAVSEPDFSEMYTDLVLVLRARSPNFPRANDPTGRPSNFQRGIVVRCQEEFEHIKSFSKLDLPAEMLATLSEDDVEAERKRRKKLTLGNMRFIGELYMRKILVTTALKQILYSLVERDQWHEELTPEPHLIECICELLTTIGSSLEGSPETLDTLLNILDDFRKTGRLEKRIEYKIQDLQDLRANKWRQKSVYRTKAKALSDIRMARSGDLDVAGIESNYPYKHYVIEWNDRWLTKRKEEKSHKTRDDRDSPNRPEGGENTMAQTPNQRTLSEAMEMLLTACRSATKNENKNTLLNAMDTIFKTLSQEDYLLACYRLLVEDESDPMGEVVPLCIFEATRRVEEAEVRVSALRKMLNNFEDFALDKPTAGLCLQRFLEQMAGSTEETDSITFQKALAIILQKPALSQVCEGIRKSSPESVFSKSSSSQTAL